MCRGRSRSRYHASSSSTIASAGDTEDLRQARGELDVCVCNTSIRLTAPPAAISLPGVNARIACTTVALATVHDLRRRPGILLAAGAVAALLLLLPELSARAMEDTQPLALQAGISTLSLFLVFVAGFAGLRAGSSEGALCASAEWRAAPIPVGSYVLGRFAGVLLTSMLLLGALVPFLVVRQLADLRETGFDTPLLALALVGVLSTAALFAALGLLLSAAATPQLAAILLVAALIATRVVIPEMVARGGLAGTLARALPDPAQVDLSREFAFQRPVTGAAAALALAAITAHTSAFLVLAAWRLRQRA